MSVPDELRPFLDGSPSSLHRARCLLELSRLFPDGVAFEAQGPAWQRAVTIPLAVYCDPLSSRELGLFLSETRAILTRLLILAVGLKNRGDSPFGAGQFFERLAARLDELEHDLVEVPVERAAMDGLEPAEDAPASGRVGDDERDHQLADERIQRPDNVGLVDGEGVVPVAHADSQPHSG